ncbi:NAD(P)/FAD-dependent oxidoreductase [soil metagenome]
MEAKPRVLVIGAGFVGLYATKTLKDAAVEVLMIDQNNYHTFQPLLYQVATAGLEVGDVAQQVRDVFRKQENFNFRQGTVIGVDWDTQTVALADGEHLRYDYLILGAGAVYNNFGVPGVAEHSFMLKSLTEAANIRGHVLAQFERASAHPELLERGVLNFVIVGAGPTGVEMAGALVELFDHALTKDYPDLDLSKAKVILLEMTDRVMAPYSERSQKYTEKVLRRRGVDIRLNTTVAEVRAHEVELKSGETIPTETLLWAAGIRASPLVDALGLELDKGYRVKVNTDLSVPGRANVFVAGDMSGAKDAEGKMYPQVAQVAIQGGKHAAKQILADLGRTKREPFRYFDKGIMAIIGRNAGIAELSKTFLGVKLRGFLGWLGWLFIHLIYLPGHQNRFNAFANWAYNYFTFDRHVRLITFMRPSPAEVADHTGKLISPVAAEPPSEVSA